METVVGGLELPVTTGHVLELHLASLSQDEYYSPNNTVDYYDYLFGGNINPSLLNLKHLRFLDLSNNSFRIRISEFLGNMVSLRFLNLGLSGFFGTVPPQIGNLSYLYFLDLHNIGLSAEHLHWLSNLSSLEFLDLSYVFIEASDWLTVTNSLPSLVELHYLCLLFILLLHLLMLPFHPFPSFICQTIDLDIGS
eukprot:XP_025011978.1 receptor-like protein EIX2 [Ricinus communis]